MPTSGSGNHDSRPTSKVSSFFLHSPRAPTLPWPSWMLPQPSVHVADAVVTELLFRSQWGELSTSVLESPPTTDSSACLPR